MVYSRNDPTGGPQSDVVIVKSTNEGVDFGQPRSVVTSNRNSLHTAMVTTREDPSGDDDVLVVYARVQAGGQSLEATLSLDGGGSFPIVNLNINDSLQDTFLPWAAAQDDGDCWPWLRSLWQLA